MLFDTIIANLSIIVKRQEAILGHSACLGREASLPYRRFEMSTPFRFVLRIIGTIAITWALTVLLPQYLQIGGGIVGLLIVGAILAILNVLVRPILKAIAFPLHLIAGLLAVILVNTVFLWIAREAVAKLEPGMASLTIEGGIIGLLVVAFALGITNWIVSAMLEES